MKFKCPYTEQCRAEALRMYAELPDLAAIFEERLQCAERDSTRAQRCATRLGLLELELPTLGSYVQERRRTRQIPQKELALTLGMDLNDLRDIELGKADPARLPRQIIDGLAHALSASGEYLATLARAATRSPGLRHGQTFARTTLPPEAPPDVEP
jgi:hypothetical protein